MPFRTDAEIVDLATQASSDLGQPRCRFISPLLPLIGMTDREARAIEFPNDTPEYQSAMATAFETGKTSSCGLIVEAAWRYAGVQDPLLDQSYYDRVSKGKYVIVAEQEIGKKNDAWVSGIPWVEGTPLPLPGDALIIGCQSCGESWARGTANLEHGYTIVAYDPAGEGIHHSVDGGQPGVKARTRALVQVWTGTNAEGKRTGELWASTVTEDGVIPIASDGRPLTGRRMVGYVDVSRLPLGEAAGPCVGKQGVAGALIPSSPAGKVAGVALVGTLAYFVARWLSKRK